MNRDPVDRSDEPHGVHRGRRGRARHRRRRSRRYGLTIGHEPDSIEFSTLGGWIATHASGMKKNRYGNIEDLVLDVTVVTARGVLSRELRRAARVGRRRPARAGCFGSEGNLGIVTRAVVKLFPLPEVQRYDSVLFPDFEKGVAFLLRRPARGRRCRPASGSWTTLQFQFGQTLKPRATGLAALKSKLEKFFVTQRARASTATAWSACTLVYEGTQAEVAAQERAVYRDRGAPRRHAARRRATASAATSSPSAIAYIRDFVMNHWILARVVRDLGAVEPGDRADREREARACARSTRARGLPGQPVRHRAA